MQPRGGGRDERGRGGEEGGELACCGPEVGRCGGRLRDGPPLRSAPRGEVEGRHLLTGGKVCALIEG